MNEWLYIFDPVAMITGVIGIAIIAYVGYKNRGY